MKSSSETIENLQKALSMELTAVQQYLLHAHVLDNWGLGVLADQMRTEMHEELGHAGHFIDRILFLDGTPKLAAAKEPRAAQSLADMFRADLEEEKGALAFYSDAASAAEGDIGTRMLFERIALDEEGHMDWLSQQLGLLDRMGEPSYMARHMRDDHGAS